MMPAGKNIMRNPEKPAKRRIFLFSLLSFLFSLFSFSAPVQASWNPEAVLRSYLGSQFPWAAVDISDLEVSAALPDDAPRSIVVEKSPPGRSVFRFEFRNGGSLRATAYVKTFDRVIMTRSACPRGYELKRDDVYETLMESSRLPRGAIRSLDRVVGKPLLRSVTANTPLTAIMVSETALIKRGRKVMIAIEKPGFVIRAAGQLSQDAAVGDMVKALNVQSKKIVTGMLVDENTVRVEF